MTHFGSGICSHNSRSLGPILIDIVPADKFMPVDVHVPGCPPRPEALMHGVLKLRKMVQDDPDMGWRERYDAAGSEEILRGA